MSSDHMQDDLDPARPPRPLTELRDSGLLWLINRVVFHPRGFVLALVMRDRQCVGWRLLGDGSEVWRFDGDEDEYFAAAMATLEAVTASTTPDRVGCSECGTILNANTADCTGAWHSDNRGSQPEPGPRAPLTVPTAGRPHLNLKFGLPGRGGRNGLVELDGVDISSGTVSVVVEATAGHFPRATLSLALLTGEVDGAVQLYLPAPQVELLASFGWLPPNGSETRADGAMRLTRPAEPAPQPAPDPSV